MKQFKICHCWVLAILLCICAAHAFGWAPEWWQERGVTPNGINESDPNVIDGNYDAATIGQLMNMAAAAADELNEKGGGAGSDIEALVSAFPEYNPAEPDANNEVATMGQLFTVAEPFYDRLHELPSERVVWPEGMTFVGGNGKYPWADFPATPTDDDYNKYLEAANIGQVKYLFSWSILSELAGNLMPDGFPSDWYDSAYNGTFSEEFEKIAPLRLVPISGRSQVFSGSETTKTIKVRVQDLRGRYISGVPVMFATDGDASLSPATILTDADGYAQTTFTKGAQNRYTATASIGARFNQNAEFVFIKNVDAYTQSPTTQEYESVSLDKDMPHADAPGDGASLIGGVIAETNSIKCDLTSISSQGPQWPYPGCTDYVDTYYEGSGYFRFGEALKVSEKYVLGTPEEPPDDATLAFPRGVNIELNLRTTTFEIPNYCKDILGVDYWSESFYKATRLHTGNYSFSFNSKLETGGMALPSMSELLNSGFTGSDWTETGVYFDPWIYNMTQNELESRTLYFEGEQRTFYIDTADGADLTVNLSGPFTYTQTKATKQADQKQNFSYTVLKITPSSSGNITGTGTLSVTAMYTRGPKGAERYYTYNSIVFSLTQSAAQSPAGSIIKPTSESAGPKYRKISLLGRPINDDKPQAEEESDFAAPETYIDALTQNLRHDSIDYIQRIPNSDLALSVRRNYAPQSWSIQSGLRPYERADLPFGLSWNSNLVSYVRVEAQGNLKTRTSPDTATVIDENGMVFSFAKAGGAYYPMPNSRSDAQAFLNKLTPAANGFTFSKKHGTTLKYSSASFSQKIKSDRINGGSSTIEYTYYRLTEITDRKGNKIKYEYNGNSPLLPSKIYYADPGGRNDMAIVIQENSLGGVAAIQCPEGLELTYAYQSTNNAGWSLTDRERTIADTIDSIGEQKYFQKDKPFLILSSFAKNGKRQFSYTYFKASEPDVWKGIHPSTALYDYNHFHLDLASISDGAGNSYSFSYKDLQPYFISQSESTLGGGVYINKNGYRIVPSGGQRRVASSTVSGMGTATFADDSTVVMEGNANINAQASRKLTVTDAAGNKVRYTWAETLSDVVEEELASFKDQYPDASDGISDDPFTNPWMLYYPKMKIEYLNAAGSVVSTETLRFNIGAGMALSATSDNYNNATTYVYNDPISLPSGVNRALYYATTYSDPTKETNALGHVSEFTYDANTRIMTSVKKIRFGRRQRAARNRLDFRPIRQPNKRRYYRLFRQYGEDDA